MDDGVDGDPGLVVVVETALNERLKLVPDGDSEHDF